jgi:hypothetical protein
VAEKIQRMRVHRHVINPATTLRVERRLQTVVPERHRSEAGKIAWRIGFSRAQLLYADGRLIIWTTAPGLHHLGGLG